MLDELRKPLFILAVILMGLTVIFEAGSAAVIGMQNVTIAKDFAASGAEAPGMGIPTLAVFDFLVLFTVILMGVSLVIPERVHAKTQGLVTLVVSVLMILACIGLIFTALAKVFLMIGLLLAPIFGTVAYLAMYGDFDTGTARLILAFIMSLKFAVAVLLVLAHQRFIENKGLVLIILSSLLAGIIVGFCHGIVPGFLVSITDGVAALVVLIITLVWALFFLVGSVKSVVKAVV
jgi:hypothetical protein